MSHVSAWFVSVCRSVCLCLSVSVCALGCKKMAEAIEVPLGGTENLGEVYLYQILINRSRYDLHVVGHDVVLYEVYW